MIIATVSFNYPPEYKLANYERLARVFRESCRIHVPWAKFLDIKVDPPILPEGDRHALNFLYNTVKLEKWVKLLDSTNQNVIFADADMVTIRPFIEMDIFGAEFDVGFTARTEVRKRIDDNTRRHWGNEPIRRMPMNGGIMFAKPTAAARDFYRQMMAVNNQLYDDPFLHEKWRLKYAGMNQAAFGCLYEEGLYDAVIKEFPCRKWNAVDTDWSKIEYRDTVFVHMKGRLRRLVMVCDRPFGNYKDAMKRWYDVAGSIGEPVWGEDE